MNKAKAIFAAGIMVIVASSSAALWYLNDNGLIGNEITTAYVGENEDHNDDIQENDVQKEDNENEIHSQTPDNPEENVEVDESEINEFLSTFAKVYFAENMTAFDIDKCSDYDLILFAFTHIRCTEKSLITLVQRDDNIKYYNGIAADKVNEVLDKYFGVSVADESVYTENSYAFFSYSDGYFYTPAADGLPYKNNAVVNSVEYSDDMIIAKFTIYSDGEFYADAEAKLRMENDELKMIYYSVAT